MQILPFKALYPNFDAIASPDAFCSDAKNEFQAFQGLGLYEHLPQDALYIYQIESKTGLHTGLVALDAVDDYFAGKIKKHEKTLDAREQHQMELFLRWNALLKAVLLTYPPVPDITRWLLDFTQAEAPLFSTNFIKDHQIHRVWAVTEKTDIARLQYLFATHVQATYIADGHHRTTAIAMLHEQMKDKKPEYDFSNLLCAFFSSDQLDILDYNRVVAGLKDISPAHFMVELSALFDMEKLKGRRRKAGHKHEVILYLQHEWFKLRWKPELLSRFPPDRVLLDATLLNEFVLRDILGIEDVRTDKRIIYVEGSKGPDGIRKLVNDHEDRIGFMLYAVSFEDLMHLADQGESLPPKSTYFEPRMKTGLLVKILKI